MLFLIDDIVSFDTNKFSLSNTETKDEISLPATAGCILIVLLDSNGVVERNSIIERVWEKFAFDLSNNTLNQYVSLLRKSIKKLGVDDDVILTVPKIGFYINEDIKVVRKELSANAHLDDTKKKLSDNKASFLKITVLMITFFVIIGLLTIFFFRNEGVNNYPLVKSGKIGSCDLYMSPTLNDIGLSKAYAEASLLSEKYLPCVPNASFIYDVNSLHFLTGTGKLYLSRCIRNHEKGIYTICSEVLLYE
ncbi:winged helix-turn-helix domain-containing protein [Salmonella enterica subsp. enterica]|nr:winged helix-turn-helix domain-containing protein [Salmonella enterica subsp. enterica]